MLGLDESALLLDGLRPPPGMELDAAIGSTFTLDLTALLAIPVSSTLDTDVDEQEAAELLETIRRYADRTILFCQAGAISVPSEYRAALTFVEQTVVEVRKPAGGVFHPKSWIARFRDGERTLHRVLVLSRNLTFDRSWDVVVRLDEEPGTENAVDTTELERLFGALPDMTAQPMEPSQKLLLGDVLRSLSEARLALPPGLETGRLLTFHDGGRRTPPFKRSCRDAVAISPFLTKPAVDSFLNSAGRRRTLVSRPSALNSSAAGWATSARLLKLKDLILDAEDSLDGRELADDTSSATSRQFPALRGLHAKVFAQDDAETSTLWMGSANLTDCFRTNVEVLVEFTGPLRRVGVNTILKSADHAPDPNNLSWIVEAHSPTEEGESDDELTELESVMYDLASRALTLTIRPSGPEHWDAHLDVTPGELPDGLTLAARLLSLSEELPVTDGMATWTALSQRHLTPFVVLNARTSAGSRSVLIRAQLDGDPADRRGAVLAHAISSREDFLRYLGALLGIDLGLLGATGSGDLSGGSWASAASIDRVLEDLLVTASRSPERLRTLEQTLAHLRRDEAFAQIVPSDFHGLWDAVYAARKDTL